MFRRLTLLVLTVSPALAYGYIDPGTGSILIQGLIGAAAVVGVTLKLYWHRFTGLFRRRDRQITEIAENAERPSSPD